MINHIERINRDRFNKILSLISDECYAINKKGGLIPCNECPYFTICFEIDKIEYELDVMDDTDELEITNEKDTTTDGYRIGGSI